MISDLRAKVLGVIPARLDSTRLPRKMLADIGGNPLIYHTWKRAMAAKCLGELVVATDSLEIERVVKAFGGSAVMTSPDCRSGSDRVAEAALLFPRADIVVNIQGDEPLLPREAIDAAVDILTRDTSAHMATVAVPCTDEEDIENPTNVKVTIDIAGNALYFSRARIPYPRHQASYLKHIGLYAFRRDFLLAFPSLAQTPLERAESLEQLRVLEHGYKIKVAIGDFISIGVDTQADLERVTDIMGGRQPANPHIL